MKFKELFGSFTDHRSEKRITGTLNGSTGSSRSEKLEKRSWTSRPRRVREMPVSREHPYPVI
ncbi:hypothetical protein Hanom_Chr14g01247201 [Helianthus anomalus]